MGNKKVRQCRVCGCTDDQACPGGCHWVAKNLCSECAESGKQIDRPADKMIRRGDTKTKQI
jgi:hypothetical protein